ncbi:IS3 family transposase [Nocardia rhamnosiphila]|uniref:IS3 family transposase n=1 Tax=Nocardia rhamnosiphila TaxID=426716 RepID=UPI0033C88006
MRFVKDSRRPVELVLRVLGIASSTYYWWCKRLDEPSARQVADEALLAEIVDSIPAPAAPMALRECMRCWPAAVSRSARKRVERVMRGAGLQGAFLRKRWRIASTRADPRAAPAPDLVERVFTADRPNRLWVADATRIPCGQGAFWLAAVRDAFSNRIVGWKTSDRCDTELVLGALEFAVWSRDIRDGELIHHSDRESTYTAIRFANRLADNGIAQSMGSVGDSYDNALMENFFSTLKTELVYRRAWRTRDEAESALFAYIDGWYNSQRIQKKLGWQSPDEFEASYHHPVPAGT